MSRSGSNKENLPPRRNVPWFRHHNPGTKYTYDGPRIPKVKVLSSVTVVPPKPLQAKPTVETLSRPTVTRVPNHSRPTPMASATPRRPRLHTPIPETPRRPRPSGAPRRFHHQSRYKRPPILPLSQTERCHKQRADRPTERTRTPPRRPRTPPRQRRERTPLKPRFRPPPPRSPSPLPRIVVTRNRGMRPDIPWVAPRKLNLIKPSRPRFHDSTGRDPRSRGVQVVVTLPPPDAPVRRPQTPPTPRMSPVPSPVRPLPTTPPCIKVPGPPPNSKIVYYRGSLVPGRARRHISLAYYPAEDD